MTPFAIVHLEKGLFRSSGAQLSRVGVNFQQVAGGIQ